MSHIIFFVEGLGHRYSHMVLAVTPREMYKLLQSRKFSRGLYFAKLRIFAKIKSSRNAEISLSFTDVGKSCHSRDF